MRPGYMRKNGIPYSENARLTERLFVPDAADGNQWLMLTRTVQDATYLNGDYVSSWHFKREANDAKFRPTPCSAS
jgi:hypothetical protein